MQLKLRVSKVLITGGGSGIGLATTKALLAEGCDVCICGRNLEKLERVKTELANDKLSILQWDMSDVQLVHEKLNEAAFLLGGFLNGVVNNAGTYAAVGITGGEWKPWQETSEVWDSIIDTNLKAAVFISRATATYMNNNHIKGNILNISSATGNREIISAYAASKNALIRMTLSMARQVAPFGIVMNGIAPGVTVSDINNGKSGDVVKIHAIGRIIDAEEIARVALFMLSEAAQIVIGDTILADGGYIGIY